VHPEWRLDGVNLAKASSLCSVGTVERSILVQSMLHRGKMSSGSNR
jgi:hypothetical protein